MGVLPAVAGRYGLKGKRGLGVTRTIQPFRSDTVPVVLRAVLRGVRTREYHRRARAARNPAARRPRSRSPSQPRAADDRVLDAPSPPAADGTRGRHHHESRRPPGGDRELGARRRPPRQARARHAYRVVSPAHNADRPQCRCRSRALGTRAATLRLTPVSPCASSSRRFNARACNPAWTTGWTLPIAVRLAA